MPKVYIIPDRRRTRLRPGATRSTRPSRPPRASCELLDDEELEGVIAHELAHVKHRDILISSVAATLAAAIMMVGALRDVRGFGGGARDDARGRQPDRAARDDDPGADRGDADPGGHLAVARVRRRCRRRRIAGDPVGLVNALRKIEAASKRVPLDANPATAHMFIIKPFSAGADLALQHASADRAARRGAAGARRLRRTRNTA